MTETVTIEQLTQKIRDALDAKAYQKAINDFRDLRPADQAEIFIKSRQQLESMDLSNREFEMLLVLNEATFQNAPLQNQVADLILMDKRE